MNLNIPQGYSPAFGIRETEAAIKEIKDYFERELAKELKLTRVSAPFFVLTGRGINDDLNGIDRPVRFGVKNLNEQEVEVVHSLAKWKRIALKRYGFAAGEGLYTDMNAIRRDDDMDNLHSIYVDQWDWETVLLSEDRNEQRLTATVEKIFRVFKNTESYIIGRYPKLNAYLPEKVTFISSQELEDRYPGLSPKERENAVCKEYGAVFISQIGKTLRSGSRHDGRAPDYDDWELNGDLLFWYPVLGIAMEISSMGIRVDEKSLLKQLELSGCNDRLSLEFHRAVAEKELPYTMGGGIGQSRLCMFFLGKAHIGEVQASIWPEEMLRLCEENNIFLL